MLEYLALETEFCHVEIDYYDYGVQRTNQLARKSLDNISQTGF